MSELNLNSTVGQWVAEHPSTSRVFQGLKIDFCCGGGVSLEEACNKKKIDPQSVMQRLEEELNRRTETDQEGWTDSPLSELCDHIVNQHHGFLRSEFPRLEKMAHRVAKVHGETHPELLKVRDVFLGLRAELESHMMKEENVLFPAICQLEQAASQPRFPFGSLSNPIRMMEHEHDDAGNALRQLRTLTNDYEPPMAACNTYRALFDGLQELESDLHLHIHKENNILFPRAAKLENEMPVG